MKFLSSHLILVTALPSATAFAPSPVADVKRAYKRNTNKIILQATDRTEEEEIFFAKTKELCDERNLDFKKIKNARDLASVRNSLVQPGHLFRTGRVSDASKEDIALLYETLGIRTLIDLRSPTELKDDPTLDREEVFDGFTNLVWDERRNGCVKELAKGQSAMKKKKSKKTMLKNLVGKGKGGESHSIDNDDPSMLLRSAADLASITTETDDELIVEVCPEDASFLDDDTEEDGHDDKKRKKRFSHIYAPGAIHDDKSRDSRKERHFVSIINELKYVKGTVSKVRKRDIAKVLIECPGALVSKRVRGHIKKPFLDEINGGGLPMLNEMILNFGAPGIHYVLDLCKDKSRHPIAFYCTAGKDRTGMIAAIILSVAGVPDEDIVEDYSLSANVYAEMNDHQAMVGALSQRSLDAKTFLGAPPDVMRDTLTNIKKTWGSVEGYLDWIGFDENDRSQLKAAILES